MLWGHVAPEIEPGPTTCRACGLPMEHSHPVHVYILGWGGGWDFGHTLQFLGCVVLLSGMLGGLCHARTEPGPSACRAYVPAH